MYYPSLPQECLVCISADIFVQQFEDEMGNIEGLHIEKVHYGGEDMWKKGLYRPIGHLFRTW
jgi:hypothetical protein